MKNEKWLYFRKEVDMANDDGIDDSAIYPASSLISMSPSTDTALTLTFKTAAYNSDAYTDANSIDTIALTVIEGDMEEAMTAISQAINSNPHSDGFIVIADDCVTTDSATSALADLTIASQYIHPSITACVSISVASTTSAKYVSVPFMPNGNSSTVISNGLALAVNTNYHSIATAAAVTMPAAADGKVGDWITVRYTTVVNDGATHTYTTTTDTTFTAGSCVTRIGGSIASFVDICSGSGDNVLTIDGGTDGDGGIGTTVKFVNSTGNANGWMVEAVVLNQGDGTTASTGTVFS